MKTNVDISIKINHGSPPFRSNAQQQGIWNECFNWPDVANFPCAYAAFRFHPTQPNASISASARKMKKIKKMIHVLVLVLCACIMLASTPFSR